MPQETSVSKPLQLNHWNVVRSKSVPSGVSGSHAIAGYKPAARTDASILNQEDAVSGKPSPARVGAGPSHFPVIKQ